MCINIKVLAVFEKNVRISAVRNVFGAVHGELTRSEAANDYVWKEETRVSGTQFELGRLPMRRNSKTDWDMVKEKAKLGEIEELDADVFVRHYRTLRIIASDYAKPEAYEKEVIVYWGKSGTGKSRTAWELCGMDAYPKDPRTKFWCGYQKQDHVIIDEFRGGIDIGHMLRWLDRYPVIIETKGSSTVLRARRIFITSNLHPKSWYPELDAETLAALLRRMKIVEFK